ncbi:MAG TPA: four helix bundle protein, partial [Anaerolineae bacterium]|nr:four helix bundle protein [Anaerolineae bacterium]
MKGTGARKQDGLEKIEDRTYRFALRVVKLVQAMPKEVASSVLARQLLRAATSIGANVEEALAAESKRDFTHKMGIAHKEARETHYWLRLISDAGIVPAERMGPITREALEIKKILWVCFISVGIRLRKSPVE